jgi:hypothetical protein
MAKSSDVLKRTFDEAQRRKREQERIKQVILLYIDHRRKR